MMQEDQQFQPIEEGGKHGALVEEARRLMADDDDGNAEDAPKADDDNGPKIKMGRIGKKKKKNAARDAERGG